MPAANPIIDGIPLDTEPAIGYEPPAANGGPETHASTARGMSLGSGWGFGSIDNTSNHVAVLVVGASLVVAFLYFGGFNFAVDAGVVRK